MSRNLWALMITCPPSRDPLFHATVTCERPRQTLQENLPQSQTVRKTDAVPERLR